jgi:DNA repair protein RadA/Sms
VKLRAERLGGAERVEILAETELETVCETLRAERPDVCVIDSVQTLHATELGSAPGSVAQVRESASRLLRVAKEYGIATILVGHVTKDGTVAGPRVLEHLVDCVLQFRGRPLPRAPHSPRR